MEKRAICRVDELDGVWCKIVVVEGNRIALFLVDGDVRAFQDFCPHAGAPLSGGTISNGVVRCPWHGWEFDLRTGAHVANPRCTLDGYRVEVADGVVFVWA